MRKKKYTKHNVQGLPSCEKEGSELCSQCKRSLWEGVQWVWRERGSVEQSGSSSGVSFGICLIDPYQCINNKKWRLTFVCTIYRIYPLPFSRVFHPLLLTLQKNGRVHILSWRPKMSTTKHSQLQIGRLVCFSPSKYGRFSNLRSSYFLDLMKKGLSLAADFGILRVDHVLR